MSPHTSSRDHLYLDVSCVRIQSYLSRTPRLRGRRGASAAIAEATRFDDGACPFPGARLNREAGDVDGVISLLLDAPAAGDDADAVAADFARRVFRRLRERLPAAEFQAVWATGPTYLDAHHRGIGPRLRRGDVLADLPPVPELPYTRICDLCHLDPAQEEVHLGDGQRQFACPDCLMRFSRTTREEARTSEYDLGRAVGAPRRAGELTGLAELGGPGSDRNHIATVFIDGNAFGDFFERLATVGTRLPPGTKAEMSRELNTHTRTALAEAVRAVRQETDGELLCAVPYLVGGDDVLVSLPADRGWVFTRHYLRAFGQLADKTREKTAIPGLPRLSASAGLVFAHAKAPFHEVVEEAAHRLAAAKSLVRGDEASVDFADLTAGHTGGPVRLADLDTYAGRLDALAALPDSARHTVAAALRRTSEHRTTAVENHALRLGHDKVFEPFLADGTPITLASALQITRWWR